MIQLLKQTVKRSFASPLGWRIFGPILRRPGVIVLTYHRINGADRSLHGLPIEKFAAQMRWVRDNCDPIGPDEMMERVERPSRVRPAVLVTFDDGYRDYHDLAYPVLKALRIPALVFLATSFMDDGGLLWTDVVQWASLSTRRERVKLPWSGESIALPDAEARNGWAKRRAPISRRSPTPIAARRCRPSSLSWESHLRARARCSPGTKCARRSTTRFTAATRTPIPSSRASTRAAADREIRTCRDRIAAETGKTPTYFAYPNGRPADYTVETQEILRSHGFTIAFSTSEGIAGAGTDWMAVKRLPSEAITSATSPGSPPASAGSAAGLSR